MLNIIIKAIFFVIGKIGDIIFAPIMLIISSVAPNLSVGFNYIFDFLENGFTYFTFFLKTLCIPPACIQIVVLVFTTSLTLTLAIRSYSFIVKIYNNFKP